MRFTADHTCLWLPPDPETLPGPDGSPTILFLHGVGERGCGGAELPRVAAWGLPKLRLRRTPPWQGPLPFLLLAPQCPPDARWCDDAVLEGLDALLLEATEAGSADPARLVVAGFSMGGVGAYCAAISWPQRFAGLVSVCGACEQPRRLAELAHLHQWVAWAEGDEIEHLAKGSRAIADTLGSAGRLIARPYRLGPAGSESAHVRTADAAFAEPELVAWLLRRTMGEAAARA